MVSLLSKIFIKNRDDITNPAVRKAYGSLCSALGITLNVLLFAGKYAAGLISGSIAITADAFNNLSDAGSSAISLIGFRLAGKKPDPDHPFGHGRLEYISGLCVAALILVMGVELLISSVEKIISPEPVENGLLPAIILIVSIGVKVYMSLYNRAIGKKISSSAMLATATDSLSDSVATAVVLLSMLVSYLFSVNIDGYAGVLVALFILFAGVGVARDTLSPLLGQAPDPELVRKIEDIVMARDEIIGMHDLVVHDYGPGRLMISLHAEVDGRGDIFELHDAVDVVERTLAQELGCEATIHMDPVVCDDERVDAERARLLEIIADLGDVLSIHDFRMVPGPSHTNLVFDAVIPSGLSKTAEEVRKEICQAVEEKMPGRFAVVTVDTSYVK